jgi:hypothetical protein
VGNSDKRTVLRAFGRATFRRASLFEHQPWPATYFAGGGTSLFKLDKQGSGRRWSATPIRSACSGAAPRADRDVAQAMEKLRTWS